MRTERGEVVLRPVHLAASHRPDIGILVVINLDPAVGWTWFPMSRRRLDKKRRGQLLYPEARE